MICIPRKIGDRAVHVHVCTSTYMGSLSGRGTEGICTHEGYVIADELFYFIFIGLATT